MTVRLAGLGVLALLVAGCSGMASRPPVDWLVAQQAREQRLAELDGWTIRARLAVSAGEQGGSGSLRWTHTGSGFDFLLQAPVTGRSFRLHGDGGGVVLEGLEGGPLRGRDAGALLQRVLGVAVPVAELDYWVRGMRAPGSKATLSFAADGLPQTLVQAGWLIEYKDWFAHSNPPLPQRVFASRGDSRVRLVITDWALGQTAGSTPEPAAEQRNGRRQSPLN